jgi:hypothetical protein
MQHSNLRDALPPVEELEHIDDVGDEEVEQFISDVEARLKQRIASAATTETFEQNSQMVPLQS